MKHYIIPANAYHKLKTLQQQQHQQQRPPPEVVSPMEEDGKFIIDKRESCPTFTIHGKTQTKDYVVKKRLEGHHRWCINSRLEYYRLDQISRYRPVKKKAEGWQEFNAALKSINTPMALISPRIPLGTHDKKQWLMH
jgi:hypothetical protein